MHLIFLVHGLFGNPGHLRSMADSSTDTLDGSTTVIYCAKSMSAVGTFNGVVANAHKLEKELLSELHRTKASQVSIVGYSMGGLCGRYLVGLLEERGVFKKVEPMVFATFATPHVGTTFPVNSAFGKLFDFIGSHITGVSGYDLFNSNNLSTELADPSKKFYQGSEQFRHLLLFANSTRDRTVPFWTAYITPVDPFRYRPYIDLHRHESNWRFVDLLHSRWRKTPTKRPPRTWGQIGQFVSISCLSPIFLTILIILMSSSTIYTAVNNLFTPSKSAEIEDTEIVSLRSSDTPSRRSAVGDELMSDLGDAVNEALELTSRQGSMDNSFKGTKSIYGADMGRSSVTSALGLLSPGYKGLIESCPETSDLNRQIRKNIANLNQLPWMKYAVRIPALNAHGVIVDRNNRKSEGKNIMDFFAETVAKLVH